METILTGDLLVVGNIDKVVGIVRDVNYRSRICIIRDIYTSIERNISFTDFQVLGDHYRKRFYVSLKEIKKSTILIDISVSKEIYIVQSVSADDCTLMMTNINTQKQLKLPINYAKLQYAVYNPVGCDLVSVKRHKVVAPKVSETVTAPKVSETVIVPKVSKTVKSEQHYKFKSDFKYLPNDIIASGSKCYIFRDFGNTYTALLRNGRNLFLNKEEILNYCDCLGKNLTSETKIVPDKSSLFDGCKTIDIKLHSSLGCNLLYTVAKSFKDKFGYDLKKGMILKYSDYYYVNCEKRYTFETVNNRIVYLKRDDIDNLKLYNERELYY